MAWEPAWLWGRIQGPETWCQGLIDSTDVFLKPDLCNITSNKLWCQPGWRSAKKDCLRTQLCSARAQICLGCVLGIESSTCSCQCREGTESTTKRGKARNLIFEIKHIIYAFVHVSYSTIGYKAPGFENYILFQIHNKYKEKQMFSFQRVIISS